MHYDILNLLIDILVSTFVAAFVARFWVAARYKWDQSRKARNKREPSRPGPRARATPGTAT